MLPQLPFFHNTLILKILIIQNIGTFIHCNKFHIKLFANSHNMDSNQGTVVETGSWVHPKEWFVAVMM